MEMPKFLQEIQAFNTFLARPVNYRSVLILTKFGQWNDLIISQLRLFLNSFISRVPRSLEDLGHFKASEYKSFLLYYGLPCLLGILPDEYYQYFLLLVQAVFSLLKESITERDLKQASALLKHFCLNMSVFYGKRYETSNVHLLLHLVEKVRDLGPLWSQSCFYFFRL